MSHACSAYSNYSSTRTSFMKKLQELLDDYADFELLVNIEKSSHMLGSEL